MLIIKFSNFFILILQKKKLIKRNRLTLINFNNHLTAKKCIYLY